MRQVSKTALVKLVYLLDCLHAEGNAGATASRSQWYFHHYGPFARDLMDGIDVLAERGLIASREGAYGDKDFTLYWLGEYPQGPSLRDVGLSSSLGARFAALVSKFGNDLAKLLDHVYFRTLPMQDTTPGEALDFTGLGEMSTAAPFRPVAIRDHAAILRIAEVANRFRMKAQERQGAERALKAHRPIYDGEFERAMADEPVEEGDYTFEVALGSRR